MAQTTKKNKAGPPSIKRLRGSGQRDKARLHLQLSFSDSRADSRPGPLLSGLALLSGPADPHMPTDLSHECPTGTSTHQMELLDLSRQTSVRPLSESSTTLRPNRQMGLLSRVLTLPCPLPFMPNASRTCCFPPIPSSLPQVRPLSSPPTRVPAS